MPKGPPAGPLSRSDLRISRQRRGPRHGPGVSVAQVDGQGGLGHCDADNLPGVHGAEVGPLARITPELAVRRCTVTGSLEGRGGGPARPYGSRAAGGPLAGQRVGPDSRLLPGVGVEELQQPLLDPDPDLPAGQDLGGQEAVGSERDGPASGSPGTGTPPPDAAPRSAAPAAGCVRFSSRTSSSS